MLNICWFEIRVRGTKEACLAFVHSGFFCSDMHIIDKRGTDNDFMVYIVGICRWSIRRSLVNVQYGESLAQKAKRFDIEVEAYGLCTDGCCERFCYRGAETLEERSLPAYYTAEEWHELPIDYKDRLQYRKGVSGNVYGLRGSFRKNFQFKTGTERPTFSFTMSFNDLEEAKN